MTDRDRQRSDHPHGADDPLAVALDVIRRGMMPVPLKPGKKNPDIPEWQHLTITADNAAEYFNGAALNVGAIWGPKSNGHRDIDLDCIEAIKLAPYFLPRTNAIYGRASKRESHRLYVGTDDPDEKAVIKLMDDNKASIVELRLGSGGKGSQSVMPGSRHPSGELVDWDEDGAPGRGENAELKAAIVKIAAGALLARHWPEHNRHDACMRVGGFLARCGWNVDEIAHFVVAVQQVAGVSEPSHVENGRAAAVDAANHHQAEGRGYGFPALAEVFGEGVVECIAKHVRYREIIAAAAPLGEGEGVTLADFFAYMPQHNYIYVPSRDLWPSASVNARIPPIPILDEDGEVELDENGDEKKLKANAWLDQNRPVEQMTWAPGLPMLIPNRLVSDGGWIERQGVSCFNLFRPPTIELGDPTKADPWRNHVRKVYPDDADHIIYWLAHRRQKPQDKINHALLLGGPPGIGKDTLLEPAKHAVGPWNFHEISPKQVFGRFNGFLKSTVMRINEARDLGDISRYEFYDAMKAYTAAPPDVLRVDEKNLREHYIINCVGVVVTTNYKDAVYLPPDDRRTYVAWSELTKDEFNDDYWKTLWEWYDAGGYGHVAAYLATLDISNFNAKAPPTKTPAFWAVVDANRPSEDSELADRIDMLQNPDALTLKQLIEVMTTGDLSNWLTDRRNRRAIPHRLERCGYVPVRNPDADDGYWKIGTRQVVYAKSTLTKADQFKAVTDLMRRLNAAAGTDR